MLASSSSLPTARSLTSCATAPLTMPLASHPYTPCTLSRPLPLRATSGSCFSVCHHTSGTLVTLCPHPISARRRVAPRTLWCRSDPAPPRLPVTPHAVAPPSPSCVIMLLGPCALPRPLLPLRRRVFTPACHHTPSKMPPALPRTVPLVPSHAPSKSCPRVVSGRWRAPPYACLAAHECRLYTPHRVICTPAR